MQSLWRIEKGRSATPGSPHFIKTMSCGAEYHAASGFGTRFSSAGERKHPSRKTVVHRHLCRYSEPIRWNDNMRRRSVKQKVMWRRLYKIATVASPVVCIVSVGLLVRSQWVCDHVSWAREGRTFVEVSFVEGSVFVSGVHS